MNLYCFYYKFPQLFFKFGLKKLMTNLGKIIESLMNSWNSEGNYEQPIII